jgi:hypothetical protein
MAGAAAVLLAAGFAQAQDGPSTGPGSTTQEAAAGPRTSSPFWGSGGYGDDHRDRRGGYDDEKSFAESFPVDLAAQVAPARERYVAMKYGYEAAQDRLSDRIAELRREFEESEEYRSIQEEMDQTQESMRQAREQALAPLMDDPQYRALIGLQEDLEAQIRAEHRSPNPDPAKIRGMSELAMAYTRQRREMETGLTGTDTSIESGQDRLRELADQRAQMEADFDRELRSDESLSALRDEIEQYRIAYRSAEAYYASAVRSADIAADFAYYNASTRGGFAHGGYGQYPYGYPYGGYGWGGHFRGGLIVAGIPGGFGRGSGPIRLRPVIYPTPILSHTFRGINHVPNFQPGAPGGQAPEIPTPEE